MPKRTQADGVENVPAGAKAGQRQRLLELAPRQLRSRERALAAREQQVAEAERALSAREQQVAAREQKASDAEHTLATTEHKTADAERLLSAKEHKVRDSECALDTSMTDAQDKQATLDQMIDSWKAGEHVCVPSKAKHRNKLTVNVKKPGADSMCFLTSSDRTLKKLMCRYCEIQDLDVSVTKFFLELKSTDNGDAPRLVDGSVLYVLNPEAMAEK